MIKLTPKTIGKYRLSTLVVSPSYISNTHWAIHRSQVKNEKEYACAAIVAQERGKQIEDTEMVKVIPCFNGQAPLATGFTWARKVYVGLQEDYAIFEHKESGKVAWFARNYIEGLNLEHALLYPSEESLMGPFITDDRMIAVMPVKQVAEK